VNKKTCDCMINRVECFGIEENWYYVQLDVDKKGRKNENVFE